MNSSLTNAPLRFQLPEGIVPVISQEIPEGLRYVIPYGMSQSTKWDTGSFLEQGIIQKGFGFCILNFSIERSIELKVEATQAFSAIQYTLQGETTAKLTGFGFVILAEGTYTSMYIPAGVHKIWFKPGQYTFFYLLLSDDHLQFLQEDHPHLQALVNNIGTGSQDGLILERMAISASVRWQIDHLIQLQTTGTLLKFELEQLVIKLLLIYNEQILQLHTSGFGAPSRQSTDLISVYVLDNLTSPEDINIQKLLSMFNSSERTLERHFKSKHDETLRTYLKRLRMDRALFMLLSNEVTISEVVAMLGYKDVYTFSRQFTNHYGYSPKNASQLFYNL